MVSISYFYGDLLFIFPGKSFTLEPVGIAASDGGKWLVDNVNLYHGANFYKASCETGDYGAYIVRKSEVNPLMQVSEFYILGVNIEATCQVPR